jgi:ATP-dependent DNA ligase
MAMRTIRSTHCPADAKARLRDGPARIAPMVATPTYERYSRKGLFELKWDGERCLAFRHGSVLMLYSRSP